MDNKIISGILVALFGLLMAWGIWVTNGNYKAKEVQGIPEKIVGIEKAQAVSRIVIENVRSDVNQLKVDTKEIRVELKEQREIIYGNQEKILERLGAIHRSVKVQEKEMNLRSNK